MCSNFGFNLHPGRAPAAVESHWRSVLLRMLAFFRRKVLVVPGVFRH